MSVHLDLVNLHLLYLNFDLVWDYFEVWRLGTNFLFFGDFGLSFIFHLIFFIRHSTLLEESSFRGRTADFLFLYLFCAFWLLIADMVCWWSNMFHTTPMFLGPSLAMSIVYVWARRNPNMRMNLLGFLNFNAPFLPWVIIGIESLLGQEIQWFDIVGIVVGHLYYFLMDVYPKISGRHLLHTPALLKYLLDTPEQVVVNVGAHDDLQQGDQHPQNLQAPVDGEPRAEVVEAEQ
eukprot:TRINITY_DN3141_c0_g1_i1.p1 TRINITY_DN3141_c0_g1~~TRINITY_DN3141_c0_g1_i1.p1  ORF type:complete len:244 (+),score=36.78 TRINITY_DN3141_c0_g1_i1:36-734(+)